MPSPINKLTQMSEKKTMTKRLNRLLWKQYNVRLPQTKGESNCLQSIGQGYICRKTLCNINAYLFCYTGHSKTQYPHAFEKKISNNMSVFGKSNSLFPSI